MPRGKRIVVKCGTQLLTTPSGLDEVYIEQIAAQIAALMQDEVEVVLVTSGAVAAGRATLHLRGNQLITRQVLAAVGQAPLIAAMPRRSRSTALSWPRRCCPAPT